MERLMSVQLSMFDQVIYEDSPSTTSLPELVVGPSHLGSPAGLTIAKSGLVHARANLSARQAKDLGLLTSGTFGLFGITSSKSSSLQRSLESKLMRQLDSAGSTLFKLTWKPLVTSSGLRSFLLRASALRTADIELGSWGTPSARDYKDGSPCKEVPINGLLGRQVWMAAWCSPTAQDANRGSAPPRPQDKGIPLSQQVTFAQWSTPRANKRGFPDSHGSQERPLDSGMMPTGYLVQMTAGGPLNPEFSRWLMGYPQEWTSYADLAMPSSRKSRKSSLNP